MKPILAYSPTRADLPDSGRGTKLLSHLWLVHQHWFFPLLTYLLAHTLERTERRSLCLVSRPVIWLTAIVVRKGRIFLRIMLLGLSYDHETRIPAQWQSLVLSWKTFIVNFERFMSLVRGQPSRNILHCQALALLRSTI